jgi:hypothetical protein
MIQHNERRYSTREAYHSESTKRQLKPPINRLEESSKTQPGI